MLNARIRQHLARWVQISMDAHRSPLLLTWCVQARARGPRSGRNSVAKGWRQGSACSACILCVKHILPPPCLGALPLPTSTSAHICCCAATCIARPVTLELTVNTNHLLFACSCRCDINSVACGVRPPSLSLLSLLPSAPGHAAGTQGLEAEPEAEDAQGHGQLVLVPDAAAPSTTMGLKRRRTAEGGQGLDAGTRQLPAGQELAPSGAALVQSPSLISCLPLAEIVLPVLLDAISGAARAAHKGMAGANSPAFDSWSPSPGVLVGGAGAGAGAWVPGMRGGGEAIRARRPALLWKLVLCTGMNEEEGGGAGADAGVQTSSTSSWQLPEQGHPALPAAAPPRSRLHLSAAAWLRTKLACGRSAALAAGPCAPAPWGSSLPDTQGEDGEVLSLVPVPANLEAALTPEGSRAGSRSAQEGRHEGVAVCVRCVRAAAVAAEPKTQVSSTTGHRFSVAIKLKRPPAPQAGYGSALMAATSGILMLVGGPLPSSSSSPPTLALSTEAAADLSRSWSHLRVLLERLAVDARVPLVLLALTPPAGTALVASHLEAAAAAWPLTVASRVACFRVLSLLPHPAAAAEAALVHGLR
jgi:hypothetical protein